MTIEKAIEIKEQEQLFHPRVHNPDKWDANQLSIEALNRIEALRNPTHYKIAYLLPSESEE